MIVLKPGRFLGRTKLTFLNSPGTAVDARFLFERLWLESHQLYDIEDPLRRNVREIKAAEPNRTYFAIIPPLGYYECIVTLGVENGYEAEKRVGRVPTDIFTVVIPKFERLKLKYSMSSKKWADKSIDLPSAREAWKKFGELVLDSDGDYNIESDTILNIVSR